jgi:hypothetical protein
MGLFKEGRMKDSVESAPDRIKQANEMAAQAQQMAAAQQAAGAAQMANFQNPCPESTRAP